MYRYSEFDHQFVRQRAAQFRDQLTRHLAGTLSADDFGHMRRQNGWYVQRHAPMARVAIPYGTLSSTQMRALARIARNHDRGYGHFTTRTNIQFNWIPLERAADVMDELAEVGMHGIQTCGNCIRNITADAFAGIARDEVADPRPFCEIMRQWSSLHPEFAALPRKFKIAVNGALEDRAATAWYDVGLQLRRNEAGELGFQVRVGGGMGRTPMIGSVIREFLPWPQLLAYLEAVLRVYNEFGRRDNIWKARIKVIVKAFGAEFTHKVEEEFAAILGNDGDGVAPLISEAELARVAAHFETPKGVADQAASTSVVASLDESPAYRRWRQRNVHPHRLAGHCAVTLSLKRPGQAPGDTTDRQMDAAAELADHFSAGELRVTHQQNLVLPWVREADLHRLWLEARESSFATPNVGLLTDMICCPGGDVCSLANARSIPVSAHIAERFDDLDELHDIGDISLNISGCINSCGHHHSGHIGVLGVDKDGEEWYQVTLGGTDGAGGHGPAAPGRVLGPAFRDSEIPDVIESLIETYLARRQGAGERFIDTFRRLGVEPFRAAANRARRDVAEPALVE
ncbi:MAG TPA: nitrite/sulfite reductase [Caldimonas sp.]|nr:nitrite/sulfite reductase [Caldimonas sp.]